LEDYFFFLLCVSEVLVEVVSTDLGEGGPKGERDKLERD